MTDLKGTHTNVTAPIIGARTLKHLEDNLAGADLQLGDSFTARLDAVSAPTPDEYPYGPFGDKQRAHLTYPGWSEGTLNMTFMEIARTWFADRGHQVTETFIERGYDPAEEVAKHVAADLVILQTPVNWFGAPWIYKKYVDEVFNLGLATKELLADDGRTRDDPTRQYGTGGKMQGKRFMICATWNAPRETFDNPESFMYAGKGSADLFLNITSNYKFVGFDILPDFGVWNIFKDPKVPQAIEGYKQHLDRYCSEKRWGEHCSSRRVAR